MFQGGQPRETFAMIIATVIIATSFATRKNKNVTSCVSISVTKILGACLTDERFPLIHFDHHEEFGCRVTLSVWLYAARAKILRAGHSPPSQKVWA